MIQAKSNRNEKNPSLSIKSATLAEKMPVPLSPYEQNEQKSLGMLVIIYRK